MPVQRHKYNNVILFGTVACVPSYYTFCRLVGLLCHSTHLIGSQDAYPHNAATPLDIGMPRGTARVSQPRVDADCIPLDVVHDEGNVYPLYAKLESWSCTFVISKVPRSTISWSSGGRFRTSTATAVTLVGCSVERYV